MKSYLDIDRFDKWSAAEKDRFTVNVIKGLIMDGVRQANSGHPGGSMSSADFAYILFSEFLKFNPNNPDWFPRDRFVLSAGHESMLLYSLLYFTGWLTMDDLKQFRQLHSRTPGHPEVGTPGVEATTGPLGQGVGVATGMAVAEVILRHLLQSNIDDVDTLLGHFIYVLAGDGDLQEPVALGAAALAGHWGLARLIMFYDSNRIQISGSTNRADSTNIAQVFEGFGWQVQNINGHDHLAIRKAILNTQSSKKPSLIIGQTTMASGAANLEGRAETHGSPLPREEIEQTKEKLGLAPKVFWVPDCVVSHFKHRFQPLQKTADQWDNLLRSERNNQTFDQLWRQVIEDELPALGFPAFEEGSSLATRKAFGNLLETYADRLPNLVGGSADLEPSNYTGGFAQVVGDFQKGNPAGRNLAFGVREFPMAAILNGLSLHGGIIPFGGTFLVFADYERPALRLAAMQKVRVIHELTHDSFFVGEDGPTHQPVEQTMALRTIPNFYVFRPADAKETAACFKIALESRESPSALLLSRQGVPVLGLDNNYLEQGVRRGGYVVKECEDSPEIVLIATGSEVALAIQVAERMSERRVRVVSLPCWELFDQQPKAYRQALIPFRGCLKVSIEAGITMGWERYVGSNGFSIGWDYFGASAPAHELANEFGFTADQIEMKIRNHIARLL